MTYIEYTSGGTGTATISGAVNGTNTLFTLPVAPIELQVYLNGLLLTPTSLGVPVADYIWGGTSTFTFTNGVVPNTGDVLTAWVFRAC